MVANDGTANFLWRNDGSGRFEESGVAWGVATNLFGESEAGMGIALADLNDDLRPDVLLTHVDRETNTLYASVPDGYVDATIRSGLGPPSTAFTGFGVGFLDVQLDGHLDVAIANGRVRQGMRTDTEIPDPEDLVARYGQFNQLFLGSAEGLRFRSQSDNRFAQSADIARGLVAVDIDRDGDLDLLTTATHGQLRLWRNDSPRLGTWLGVELQGQYAVGARVTLLVGQRRVSQWVLHSRSYLASVPLSAHFGLGAVDELIITQVRWADGRLEAFELQPGRWHALQRGAGTSVEAP